MTRSRAAGIAVVVVLVAGASGTAAASGVRPADRATATSVTGSAPAAASTVAFALPDLPASAQVATQPAVARHHRHAPTHRHANRPAPLPPCPGTTSSPHFATPQGAMRYLARAWNHHNLDALCHVTDPDARRLLDAMQHEAVHLRLAKCEYLTVGIYGCTFRHDYPRRLHQHGLGHAFMQVAAARTPGWYTTGSIGCG